MPTIHQITDEAGLEAVLGEPMEYVRAKITETLSDSMREFIQSWCKIGDSAHNWV
ncbi:hypothetical protein [Novosphingobium sp. Chol11]|uniref:hypothetical protein n=1 Tax=Novosphingobium sp. Chol11 TaxID=1385763 RepID=UPI0025ECF9A5|nr:hypothetical protein [Novosphingobium sp. Chol11]